MELQKRRYSTEEDKKKNFALWKINDFQYMKVLKWITIILIFGNPCEHFLHVLIIILRKRLDCNGYTFYGNKLTQ